MLLWPLVIVKSLNNNMSMVLFQNTVQNKPIQKYTSKIAYFFNGHGLRCQKYFHIPKQKYFAISSLPKQNKSIQLLVQLSGVIRICQVEVSTIWEAVVKGAQCYGNCTLPRACLESQAFMVGELIYAWKKVRLKSHLGSNLTFFPGSNLKISH